MTLSDNTTPHLARNYDTDIGCTIPYYQSFHQETVNIIKALGIKPKIWLDTGCGTGSLIKRAIEEFPQTCFIMGDPSQDMLIEAKEKLSKYPPDRLKFLESSTQQLSPKKCQKADVITAIQSHHYLSPEDRKNAENTCYELLNDNGVFITFENIRPATAAGIKIGKENWRNFQISCGRDEQVVDDHLKRFNKEYFPITVEDHISLLKEVGFKVVELLWFSYMQAGFYAIK
ncbi:MAG: class I SAM-dependent methyltransferase [Methanobacteriaceae archaeon]|nr:class I SAM-dependent methyltransferase [Methanobacteriaceae archaeon]